MIRIRTGKPGGGKTYDAVREIVEELVWGTRIVSTNVSLKIGELNAFIQKRYPGADVDIFTRIRILTEDETRRFWLHHAPGESTPDVTDEQEKRGIYPNFTPRKEKFPQGVLFVIDEAHISFDARAWALTGRTLSYYASQHRKLNDEVIFITQHLDQLEKRLRNLAFEFTNCTNMGMLRVMTFFRLPKRFKTTTTYKAPPAPIDVLAYRKIDLELAACYDTMAGVGISGRALPERKEFKGLNVAWLAVPAALGAFALYWVPELLTRSLVAGTSSDVALDAIKQGPGVKGTPVSQDTSVPGEDITQQTGRNPAEGSYYRTPTPVRPQQVAPRQEPVWIVGSVVHRGKFNLVLSDGRRFSEVDAATMTANRNYVDIEGERIWWKTVVPPALTSSPRS